MKKQPRGRPTALDRIEPAAIDYAVGVLRGLLGEDWLSEQSRVHLERSITHMRGAARLIERLQRTERKRSK